MHSGNSPTSGKLQTPLTHIFIVLLPTNWVFSHEYWIVAPFTYALVKAWSEVATRYGFVETGGGGHSVKI